MLVLKNMIAKNGHNWESIKTQLLTMLIDICVSMYKYENLPKEIPPYMIELILFGYGQGVFFEKGGKYFVLPTVLDEVGLNLYAEPFQVKAIGLTGEQTVETFRVRDVGISFDDIKKKNAVQILNNVQRMPTIAKVFPYVDRLDFLWSSMGINESMSRVQLLASCSKGQYNSYKAVLDKLLDKRSPSVLVRDKSMVDGISTLDFNVEYMCDKYWYDFDKCLTMLCTVLGINTNFASQKKERLISDEVNANNELIGYLKNASLMYRQNAIKEINDMYGLDIRVEYVGPNCDDTKDDNQNNSNNTTQP